MTSNSEPNTEQQHSRLAPGFALASGAIEGQATHTGAEGLIAGEVAVPAGDIEIPAYRAQPASDGPHPLLLVVQEVFGVHEHIRDLCRRYAHQGYYAIAPELFVRQGDVSQMKEPQQILSSVVPHVPDAQVLTDLDATLAYAAASGQADASRASVVGFCWGGRIVWLYAAHNPRLRAAIAYYGRLSGMVSPIKPRDPVDIAASLQVPVLGLYAANDAGIALESVERMRSALSEGQSGSQILLFPGTAHGFNADYRACYNAPAARYAAHLAQDWLRAQGSARAGLLKLQRAASTRRHPDDLACEPEESSQQRLLGNLLRNPSRMTPCPLASCSPPLSAACCSPHAPDLEAMARIQ